MVDVIKQGYILKKDAEYGGGSYIDPAATDTYTNINSAPFSIGLVMVGFAGHACFPSIKLSLANQRDYNAVLNTSYFVCFTFYTSIAILGYLMYGRAVDEEITFEEGVLDFAQCMREEGINFPDPTFDIDGNPQFDNLEIENEEEFESAFENCEDILRNALPEQFDLDPEVEAALVDASLEFSQCMRDQGIDFPDPKPGEFGFFAFRDADIDFTSEAVQNAFEICQPENPLEDLDD